MHKLHHNVNHGQNFGNFKGGGLRGHRFQFPSPLFQANCVTNMHRSYAIFSDSLFTYLFKFRTVVIAKGGQWFEHRKPRSQARSKNQMGLGTRLSIAAC